MPVILHTNPKWPDLSAGTFAIVIGVSEYDHLPGGSGTLAANDYGLSQLTVSALTAYRIYNWLLNEYVSEDSPLAKCWLLVSPTQEELKAEPSLAKIFDPTGKPTFSNCATAIQDWYAEMCRLPKDAAEKSKALFYFVGHGIEVIDDHQMLLPADYLEPRSPRDRAISTRNIQAGLSFCDVLSQVLIFDACRSDSQQLRGPVMTGTSILDEAAAGDRNINISVPRLFATPGGGTAFMPALLVPGQDEMSFFGKEFLDGLRATPNMKLESDNGRTTVNLYPMQKFLNERLNKKFAELQMAVRSPVRIGGSAQDMPLCDITLNQQLGIENILVKLDEHLALTDSLIAPEKGVFAPWNAVVDQNVNPHDVLGSEVLTAIWSKVHIHSLATRQEIPQCAAYKIIGRETERFKGPNGDLKQELFGLTMKMLEPSTDGFWLEVQDDQHKYACVLPGNALTGHDADCLFELLLTLDFPRGGDRPFISAAEAGLSTKVDDYLLKRAAELWKTYRLSGMKDAQEMIGSMAESVLRYKFESFIAGTLAGIILLRTRGGRSRDSEKQLWEKEHWLRNLATNAFPTASDAVIVWAEQCFQDQRIDEGKEVLMKLSKLPLPCFTDCLGFAYNRVEQSAKEDKAFEQLRDRLRTAAAYSSNTGLFNVFIADANDQSFTPELTMPRTNDAYDSVPHHGEKFKDDDGRICYWNFADSGTTPEDLERLSRENGNRLIGHQIVVITVADGTRKESMILKWLDESQ